MQQQNINRTQQERLSSEELCSTLTIMLKECFSPQLTIHIF
jgi:hypothetical protein